MNLLKNVAAHVLLLSTLFLWLARSIYLYKGSFYAALSGDQTDKKTCFFNEAAKEGVHPGDGVLPV